MCIKAVFTFTANRAQKIIYFTDTGLSNLLETRREAGIPDDVPYKEAGTPPQSTEHPLQGLRDKQHDDHQQIEAQNRSENVSFSSVKTPIIIFNAVQMRHRMICSLNGPARLKSPVSTWCALIPVLTDRKYLTTMQKRCNFSRPR